MAICTNCVLLVCLYDQEGKWRIEPGLAAILIMEHVLLLIKFGFSHFVPEVNHLRNLQILLTFIFFFPGSQMVKQYLLASIAGTCLGESQSCAKCSTGCLL